MEKITCLLLTTLSLTFWSSVALADDANGVYVDSYFPLTSDGVCIDCTGWGQPGNAEAWRLLTSFDEATKTFTVNHGISGTDATSGNNTYYCGSQSGWKFSTAKDCSSYQYLVTVFNIAPSKWFTYTLINNENEVTPVSSDGTEISRNINGLSYYVYDLKGTYNYGTSKIQTATFNTVNRLYFWDGWDGTDIAPKIQISNVFLTNTLPNWSGAITRTTTTGNYGTVCLPYNASCSGAYLYKITSKNEAGTKLTLEYYNGMMEAGVPYLYKSISDNGVKFYQIETGTALTSGSTSNGLVGCISATPITKDANNYILKNNNWYKVTSDFDCAAQKAYLDLSQVATATGSAKSIEMDLNSGDITGIDNYSKESENLDIYNMQGVKVLSNASAAQAEKNLKCGVYIANGKKFIVK